MIFVDHWELKASPFILPVASEMEHETYHRREFPADALMEALEYVRSFVPRYDRETDLSSLPGFLTEAE